MGISVLRTVDRTEQRRRTVVAVLLVRVFTGLRALNLRFDDACARLGDDPGNDMAQDDEDSTTSTSTYIETILQCISGRWTKESQDQWVLGCRRWSDARQELLRYLCGASWPGNPRLLEESGQDGAMQHFPETAINISTLTVSNLSEQDSEYLKSSATMRHFIETQSLSTLQLLTSSGREEGDEFEMGWSILENKYKFVQSIPSTLLSAPIADRLRTLSLYAKEHWGFIPKLDLRALGGLPNLRTLALGMFVFTHQWQVDWVAQIGSDNGRGGLEEVYLDNCPIMWRGRVPGPVDKEGFPLKEVMIPSTGFHPISERVVVDIDLRWNNVLDEWRRRMPSLKVFRMGSGDWDGAYSTKIANAQTRFHSPLSSSPAYLYKTQRVVDTMHMNYDKPPIQTLNQHGEDAIRDGVGLSQRREHVLQYVQFEIALGPQKWVERDFKDALKLEFEDGYQRYEEARRKDEDALDALYASK
ncbi:hypothetical protein DHEL01_v210443 [Diaporthe helianthi]|uniref:F-box domain-containing protein n=1 Tax=Diaporthe helianthi TaxID=158607 RepID=A0A2P5HLM3_DIAHE|nr:hypothetical protein DHEL01_v210443 [Diaporthe helianthi]